ncbi:MAG TPA: SagB/ThcOx family dehydrogenase, partial [Thermoanaerobaculia bacterium]|nr:SagB/ThcOx family dehydrogenase [Thermoanaerobaculia bacterium]
PVQTYLYLKPGRAEGLPGGTYAYHPVSHDLVELEVGAEIDGSVYGWISQPIFEAAAFALYLVAQSRAIVPMYGDRARDFSWLEAGLMTQLLELEAPQHDLGLCQIGGFDFERVKPHLLLDDSHVLVHSLVGGAIDRASEQLHLAEAEVAAWEEGQL